MKDHVLLDDASDFDPTAEDMYGREDRKRLVQAVDELAEAKKNGNEADMKKIEDENIEEFGVLEALEDDERFKELHKKYSEAKLPGDNEARQEFTDRYRKYVLPPTYRTEEDLIKEKEMIEGVMAGRNRR